MKTAIVIGGGIAGCSTAFALAQRGIEVTLIERHEKLANGASGNPVAVLYAKPSNRPDAANLLVLQGFEFTLNLIKKLPDSEQFFKACGIIQLAFNAREIERHQNFDAHENGQILDAKSASEIAGIPLKNSGLYLPRAGFVRPQALCGGLSSHALIKTVFLSEILSIKKHANLWQVFDAQDKGFSADLVVICAANDIKQFAQCQSAKITPVRGQINFFTPSKVSDNLKTIVCSDHFVSPANAGVQAIGTTYAPNDMNPHVCEKDSRENLRALAKISPDIYQHLDMNSLQGRVAWRSQTLDYVPLAGQIIDEEKLRKGPPRYNVNPADLPWLEGLFVNAGHGSKGMITAPICAELIANLATESTLKMSPQLASRLNPCRFLLRELGLKQLANSLYQ
jgi:tRNA 5-methylaminomethyl-2-thiouridine biosynthesis bifunctional protein